MPAHSVTPQKSRYVARKNARKSAKVMFTANPTRKTGTASARLGPTRARISFARSRASSAGPHAGAQGLDAVSRHVVRLDVGEPAVAQAEVLGMESPDPRGVAPRDVGHAVDDLLPLGRVLHVLHALEQPVEFGVGVVRGVLALRFHARLGAVQQEHEVLRVRVIRVPAKDEDLLAAFADLLLEAVPVGLAHLELDGQLLELPAPPVQPRLVSGARGARIQGKHQRLGGFFGAPGPGAGLR